MSSLRLLFCIVGVTKMADSKGDGGGGRCYVGAIDQGTGSSRFLVSAGVLQWMSVCEPSSTLARCLTSSAD